MLLIDIPFKGYKGRTNRSSIVHAVSYVADFVAPRMLNIYIKKKLREYEFIFKRALAA
jgi:hypothetical protein